MGRSPRVSKGNRLIPLLTRGLLPTSYRKRSRYSPESGGEPLVTLTLPYPYNQVIRWSADSKVLFFLDRQSGVYNIWKQPLDGAAPTQVTSFTEDAVIYYDWLGDEGHLVVSRGTKTRFSWIHHGAPLLPGFS